MSKQGYIKLELNFGIYQNLKSQNYLAVKKVAGRNHQKTFSSLSKAKQWRASLDKNQPRSQAIKTTKLKIVWTSMQEIHFPSLAESTRSIWKRRYYLLKSLENSSMDEITPSKITSWVNENVQYSKINSDHQGKGNTGRCNLNNELNLLVTIFNWYKNSEKYEKEALTIICPVKRKHKQQGFIKPLPDKRKQINLQDALLFFDELKPLYKDLALLQFY